jgi:uncharacterized protein YjbI with pentapeptide repeats
MNVDELRSACAGGKIPSAPLANLCGANLYGANLRGANLYGANLRGANLYGADLRGANLRGANLYGANLRGANLRWANLYGANLYGANLRGANLYGANLRGANLRGANLYGANLRGANLYGAEGAYGLPDTPSGQGWIEVTPGGHVLHVGCWSGRVADLRAMIAPDSDIDWPEARGAEKDRRRPYLQLVADYADLVIADHPGDIEECARIKAEIAAKKTGVSA